MSRHCRKARLNTNHYHLDLHSHLEIGRIFDQSLQNALLRQSAKMKCKNDGPLRRSAKMKCKSDGLPGGADFTTPQRVCQVFFRPLVELGRFGLVCWAPDPPRYFIRLKRVCQVLNEPFLEQIRAN